MISRTALLLVALPALLVACAPAQDLDTGGNDLVERPDPQRAPDKTPAAEVKPSDPEPSDPSSIKAAKIHDGTVNDFVVTATALWILSDGVVEKAGLDGSSPIAEESLAGAVALASDGTRIFALVDHGDDFDLVSVVSDGSSPRTHAQWSKSSGQPAALTAHDGRLYVTASQAVDPSQSVVASIAASAESGDGATWQTDQLADSGSVPPAFGEGVLFTVDYVRSAVLRVAVDGSAAGVDVIDDTFARGIGGIATDATDVYLRTNKGIVKAPASSDANASTTTVVPSASCSVFDAGDGSTSTLEDTLAIDGAALYVACRVEANVEIRAYGKDGKPKLAQPIASLPYAGGVTHLRVAAKGTYWLTATASGSELWRGKLAK